MVGTGPKKETNGRVFKMGKQTEYLKGQEEFKDRILKYLKIRQVSIVNMLKEEFKDTGEIDDKVLEVMFTYNAIISDIKNDRLD